jgi:hypothetical protein
MSRHHGRRHGKFRFAHPADRGKAHDTSEFSTTNNTENTEDGHDAEHGDH